MINCDPSPAKYSLPQAIGYQNHDIRLERKPAYTFGVRSSIQDIVIGPGPAKYLLTDVTRYGKSMRIAHSFGSRYIHDVIGDTPAPNAYILPNVSRYPMYSFGSRWNTDVDSNENPSPNKYQLLSSIGGNDVTLSRAPKYSIVGRRPVFVSQYFGPGPAAYLTRLNNTNKIMPTIKSRIEHEILSNTPSPNAYSLPDIRQYPAYSFGSRWNSKVDSNGNPSPANILLPSSIGGDDFTLKRAPIYSISNHRPISSSLSFGPGPAAYFPSFETCRKLLPTLKFRTIHEISSDTPAPNHYFLQNYKPSVQKPSYTIGKKL